MRAFCWVAGVIVSSLLSLACGTALWGVLFGEGGVPVLRDDEGRVYRSQAGLTASRNDEAPWTGALRGYCFGFQREDRWPLVAHANGHFWAINGDAREHVGRATIRYGGHSFPLRDMTNGPPALVRYFDDMRTSLLESCRRWS